jgi:hypothetical protein
MIVIGGEIEFKSDSSGLGEPLPAFRADALDPSDPSYFVDEIVEGLDLKTLEARYAGMGERAIAGVHSGRESVRRVHYTFVSGISRGICARTFGRSIVFG